MMVDGAGDIATLRARMTRLEAHGGDGGSPAGDLRVEPATRAHYAALARFHYRAGPPRVISGGWALLATSAAPMARYRGVSATPEPIGVLLLSPPHLACGPRDAATAGRYAGLSQRDAASLLNREVRCISRVVIDPRFRGRGLAARLVRQALAHPEHEGIRFTEALAAMGRVHPLFERAGMTRHDHPPPPANARLLDALNRAGIEPIMLASPARMKEMLAMREAAQATWLDAELRRWLGACGSARRTLGKARSRNPTLDDLLQAARQCLLARPIYYVFQHLLIQ